MTKHEAMYVRVLGFDPEGPQRQVILDEDLPLEYPVALYRVADKALVAMTPAFEEGVEAVEELPVEQSAEEILSVLLDNIDLEEDGSVIYGVTEETLVPMGWVEDLKARLMTDLDAEALETMKASLSVSERIVGDVQVEDPLCVGVWQGETLVAAASLQPWGEDIGDVSVATHPAYRRRGAARLALYKLCTLALKQGWTVQYRHDRGNAASEGLARQLGFAPFATQEGAVVTYLDLE